MKAIPVSFTGLPDTAVAEIAALFGAEAQLQLADHPTSGPLWRIEHRSENGNLRAAALARDRAGRRDLRAAHMDRAGRQRDARACGDRGDLPLRNERPAHGRADRSRHDDRAGRTMSPRARRALSRGANLSLARRTSVRIRFPHAPQMPRSATGPSTGTGGARRARPGAARSDHLHFPILMPTQPLEQAARAAREVIERAAERLRRTE